MAYPVHKNLSRYPITTVLATSLAMAFPIAAKAEMGFGSTLPSFSYAITTGGIHIPSAELLDPGYLAIHHDNYISPRFGARTASAETTAFGYRVLPWVEVSARLSDYTSTSPRLGAADPVYGGFADNFVFRDLSANFKIQAPRIFDWQPNFAVGVTDLGGAANFFDSKYGVMTHTWGPLRTTLGYGFGPQQFDGAFGGVEIRPFDWLNWEWLNLSVLVEHDSRDSYAGVRYVSPELPWLKDSTVVATVSRAIDAKDENGNDFNHTDASVVLQIPLFDRSSGQRLPQKVNGEVKYQTPPSYITSNEPQRYRWEEDYTRNATGALDYQAATGVSANDTFNTIRADKPQPAQVADWEALQKRIVDELGFTSVRVGLHHRYSDTLVVTFENHRYTRNEVDAFGVLLGVLSTLAPSEIKKIIVVSTKNDIWTTEVQVDRLRYQMFVAGEPDRMVESSMQVNAASQIVEGDVRWQTEESDHLRANVTVEPRILSTAGTEVGNFDASVGLGTKVTVPLWKGGELLVNYNERVYDTPNFKKDGFFGRNGGGLIDGFINLAIQQKYRIGDFYNATQVGEFINQTWYGQHETLYFLNQGDTALQIRGSRFEVNDGLFKGFTTEAYQAGLLHYNEWLNAQAEITYHRYLTDDNGFELALRKYLGDISVRLSLRDSEVTRFAGFEMEIPFSFRQAPRPLHGMQLNGNSVFRTGLFTRVGESANLINLNGVAIPTYTYQLGDTMFNRFRVSKDHFKANLPRMRDAFYKFGLDAVKQNEATEDKSS